jgi:predicted DNA-binding ribbon-helix-helix protein
MKSSIVKRSIVVGGHKTSVSLEEAFWSGMKEISGARSITLSRLVSEIDANRNQGNLSSAIRQFVLDHFKDRGVAPIGEFRPRASHAKGLAETPLEPR